MTDKKVTDLTELTTPADGDWLYVVDASDSTDSSDGSSKKIQQKNARGYPQTQVEIDAGATPVNYEYEPGNVLRYGTNTTPGTTNMTTAIQTAVNVAAESDGPPVYIPEGDYLVTSTITISTGATNIIGASREKTRIIYVPTANGTLFDFTAGASTLVLCTMEKLWLHSTDTTYTKTAISLSDITHFRLIDVRIGGTGTGNTWSGATSIGLYIAGRDTGTFQNLRIFADTPIQVGVNPNAATISLDHFNFHNLYLRANGAPCVEVLTNVILSNVSFSGYQAWVKGTHGFYWNDTDTASVSWNVSFQNVRTEQGENNTAYSFYLACNSRLQGLTISNCRLDNSRPGIYLRNSDSTTIMDTLYGSTSLEALNTDGCYELKLIGVFFQAGSTVTIDDMVEKLSFGSYAATPVPMTAFYHQQAALQQSQEGVKVFGVQHWSYEGTVADDGQVNIPASSAAGRSIAMIHVAASDESSIREGGTIIADTNGAEVVAGSTNLVIGNSDTDLCYVHQSQPIIFNRLGASVEMIIDVVWRE